MIGMIKNEYKYAELTGKIIGCTMEVHKQLSLEFKRIINKKYANFAKKGL